MKPEWAKLKDSLKDNLFVEIEESSPIKDEQIKTLEELTNGISIEHKGYPTILKIQNGTPTYYTNERSEKQMADFFTNKEKHIGGFNKGKIITSLKKSRSRSRM